MRGNGANPRCERRSDNGSSVNHPSVSGDPMTDLPSTTPLMLPIVMRVQLLAVECYWRTKGMRLKVLLAACLVTSVVHAQSAGALIDVARNEHNYTLKLDLLTVVNAGWEGAANFTISACPRPECFPLSGSVLFASRAAAAEAFFPFRACRVTSALRKCCTRGMDSGDYRVTMVSRAPDGCASVPGDLTGVFKEIPSLSGVSKP